MKDKITEFFYRIAMGMQTQRHLSALRSAFASLLPVIIVGSLCSLISNVVCNTTPGYISLANVPGLAFLGNLNQMFSAANYGTMNFLAIGIVILISIELGKSYGIKDVALPIVALASYVSLCATTASAAAADGSVVTISSVLASSFTNAQGLFVGMLSSMGATEIYCRLANSGKMEIHMPPSVPSNVSRSFAVLFPSAITILAISCLGMVFELVTGMTLFDAIFRFVQTPLSSTLTSFPGFMLMIFGVVLLWSFGIHGTQALKAIYQPVLLAAFAENEAAYAAGEAIPNIINLPFMSNFYNATGAGICGGLAIAILLFSKREDYRTIVKLSIPCLCFNIMEPMMFGLPILMNPILAIPFILSSLVSCTFGYIMTSIGFCGRMVVNAPWTTPVGISAFLSAGGDIGAAITQILCVVIAVLIYSPFVIMANRQKVEDVEE